MIGSSFIGSPFHLVGALIDAQMQSFNEARCQEYACSLGVKLDSWVGPPKRYPER